MALGLSPLKMDNSLLFSRVAGWHCYPHSLAVTVGWKSLELIELDLLCLTLVDLGLWGKVSFFKPPVLSPL